MKSETADADNSSSIRDSKLPSDDSDNDDGDEDENELDDDIDFDEEWMNNNDNNNDNNNNNHDESAPRCTSSISTVNKLFKRSLFSSSRPSTSNTTNNHSEIEKRRRDRMNHLIEELSSLLPNYATAVATYKRKLDKICASTCFTTYQRNKCSTLLADHSEGIELGRWPPNFCRWSPTGRAVGSHRKKSCGSQLYSEHYYK